ncbi:MAG: hypothetical protein LBI03_07510 [Clostridiales bacterium]|jgi:hypothetical protein|nr:hypothetical protein [Clostridiales bacterium]
MKICDLIPKEMTGFRFEIKPENILAAFEAAKKTCDDFEDMETLTKIFGHFGFSAEEDQYGIGELGYCFTPERETTDLINFLETIALFIEAGSYIVMAGTEGGVWRWVFDGKTMTGQFPLDVIWPSQQLEKHLSLVFYQTSRQNYWEHKRKYDKYIDEVMFGIEHAKGGTPCELFMRWYDINGKGSPRFEMFVDSIPPMEAQFLTRIIQCALDYGNKLTPVDFCKCLLHLGFKDLSDKPLE